MQGGWFLTVTADTGIMLSPVYEFTATCAIPTTDTEGAIGSLKKTVETVVSYWLNGVVVSEIIIEVLKVFIILFFAHHAYVTYFFFFFL